MPIDHSHAVEPFPVHSFGTNSRSPKVISPFHPERAGMDVPMVQSVYD